ncbi:Bug family tripartite tricarboxylate transporter substrate binding protein [Roseococcus sp.]|uniref:Bug family tripartite tricarboxylate transporter substrate binding protein n=1 Tax=Roseococcus sp. TaxID=2109646 RepID=UPI003BADA974
MFRRHAIAGGALLPFAATRPARAQVFTRPLRLIIPVGVAGVTDIVGRVIADGIQPRLGQPVVPENVPGAGSTVGAAAFHRAANDGSVIYIGTNNHPVMKAVYPNFPYDPVTDFTPLALVGQQPFVLAVHPDVPANDLPSLIAWLRARGDQANFGSSNPGATNHLAGELFKQLSGTSFTIVPYRAAANAVQDLVAGRMNLTIDSPTMMMPLIRDGRLRPIAVSSATPSALLPGLPPIASVLPGYALTAWQVLFSRPGAPAPAQRAVAEATLAALADPAVRERLRLVNVETWPDPSADAARRHIAEEIARWTPIVARIAPG